MLIYAGIDEAGYGPMLGPLCVGLAVFAVEQWIPGEPAPDLWQQLSPAVVRTAKEANAKSGGVPVADSKKLKLSNQSKTRHPLIHLERSVRAFLGANAEDHGSPATDEALFESLGAKLGGHPWYGGEAVGLPLGGTEGGARIDAAQLQFACNRAGVRLLDLRVEMVDETRFNRQLEEHRSKAAVVERALALHLSNARSEASEQDHVRIVADRQSGRTHYGRVLSSVFGDGVVVEEESPRASRYRVGDRTGIILHSEAEDAHLPVALASMAAKLTRELAMARFNRYWSARQPELKPTAGYVQDARRWLHEARETLTRDERETMVRKA